MDPSENRVSGEGSNHCADDASNPQPLPHTVLLTKVFDLFFKTFHEATNSDVEEGEKKKEEKGEEVDEGASTKVDPFADEVIVEENEKDLGDCTEVSEKEEKEKEDEAMKNDNVGGGGIEEEMEENESNEVNEVAPRRILDIDMNKSPPHEDSITKCLD